jgi:formylglycine-generating enzyme required for sulfatase activity
MNFDKVPETPDEPNKPQWHRRKIIWVLAVVVLAAGGFCYQSLRQDEAATGPAAIEHEHSAAQAAVLESQLQGIADRIAAMPPDGGLADRRALLEQGIAVQNELMRLRETPWPSDGIRLTEWQAKLENTVARIKDGQSRDMEDAADVLVRQNQIPLALEKLKMALRLQQEVNDSLATQQIKSYGRQVELQQRIEELGAEPLQLEARQALADARSAATDGHWPEALEHYRRAMDLQQQLNRNFPRSRYSDLLAIDRMAAEMASLSASGEHGQMLDDLHLAAAAAAAGQLDEADKFYAQAAGQQRVINEQYPRSRFVSMEQLEQIEVERQTLRARAAVATIRALDAQAVQHLRRRELFQAQQQVAQAQGVLEAVVAQQPKAKGIDDDLRQRLGYLNLRAADLVQIQDQAYELLAPMPGNPQVALFKTEVPQSLYARVMNNNPSRNPGRMLPVDSVNYADAEEFCRRLGWVLGATVRLPTVDEYEAAIGDANASAAIAWGSENSMGKSQPAGQKPANALGFHDLLGNLAEWTKAGSSETAVLAGGSFADSAAQLQNVPLRPTQKTDRSRTNGFRVVAELDLARSP